MIKPNTHQSASSWRLCTAPMMDLTTRHCRMLFRMAGGSKVRLYTEMIVAQALVHGSKEKLLRYNPKELPLALQLGGSDIKTLVSASETAYQYGFSEINLNVGCPSSRVQSGRIGACLMAEPNTVAELVTAMQSVVPIPVTVKTRIGIDDMDSFEEFYNFVEIIAKTGISVLIVHARKAWLKGLDPKQNRTIPELKYEWVYRLKSLMPHLTIVLNGGLVKTEDVLDCLQYVDGVMLGRGVYENPAWLNVLSRELNLYDKQPIKDNHSFCVDLVQQYLPYLESQLIEGASWSSLIKPLLGLFTNQPGSRYWRRFLSETKSVKNNGYEQKLTLLNDWLQSQDNCLSLKPAVQL